MNNDLSEIQNLLKSSLERLSVRDRHLLQYQTSERAITHKLAEYLRSSLDERLNQSLDEQPKIDVDCEYNRFGTQVRAKRLPLYTELLIKGEPYYVANPDIVIHQRGSQSDNWLVLEVKTYFNHRPSVVLLDKLKLVGYLGDPTRYAAGVFLDIGYSKGCVRVFEAKLIQRSTVKRWNRR